MVNTCLEPENSQLVEYAEKLVDRLIRRKVVPPELREVAESFMRKELRKTLGRVTRKTSENAALLAQVENFLRNP